MISYFLLLFILFIDLLIIIVYFSKERINLLENKVYLSLIFCNVACIIIEILCNYSATNSLNYIIGEYLTRMFLVGLILWGCLLTIYNTIVSIKDSSKHKNAVYAYIYSFLIVSFPILFLSMKSVEVNNTYYAEGLAINYVLMLASIYIIINIILIICNYKHIGKKRFPVIVYMFLLVIGLFLHNINPAIPSINAVESFVCLLMFFTIENPDIRMISQLNMLKEQADQANNAKTDFLSSMSHEIRTPLNAINGFAQLILEENDINQIKEETKDIMAASESLLDIVNGILDISKIEANKLEIVNVEYEPKVVFNELVKLTKARIGEKPIDFRVNIAPDLPDYLNGDYVRVKQVIINLLTNAVKYTKEGFVSMEVKCVKKDDICRLFVGVKDSGIGIKKENIDKLFSRFERFDKENNITIEGTGLGLAITKKLIDLMHGKIVVNSIYGEGSAFAVAIDQKIVNKKKVEEETIKSNIEYDYSNKKVLIVDDNQINLKVAKRLLSTYKIDADTVSSGFECIEKINNGNTYDLILMDDMMPKMSGVETFNKLKENNNFNIPVIALTANAITGMKEKYLSDGFNDYISKPIDKKELERVLISFLD